MDPNLRSRRRLKLILGKFQVVEIAPGYIVLNIKDRFAFRIMIPPGCDIHDGDLLTLYTEVLREGPTDANHHH